MDVSRMVLVAAAALGLAIPVVQAQENDAVVAQWGRPHSPPKPWKQVRGVGRVLDLSKPPVVIDEPGLYAIQRNWRFSQSTTAVVSELIQIMADDVTLDLHGFTISAQGTAPPPFTLLVIAGSGAEIRNGRIEAPGAGAQVLQSAGRATWLHHLSVNGDEEGMTFDGDGARITDSQILGTVRLAGASTLERNRIDNGGGSAVWLRGYGNRVIDNRIGVVRSTFGVRLSDNGNIVADNVMELTDVDEGFGVEGDYNVLRANTVSSRLVAAVFQVSGTANTLDGNFAPPDDPEQEAGGPASVGIEFTADGNYYGNNRMAAQVPFSLGGTVQTDWGDNVSY